MVKLLPPLSSHRSTTKKHRTLIRAPKRDDDVYPLSKHEIRRPLALSSRALVSLASSVVVVESKHGLASASGEYIDNSALVWRVDVPVLSRLELSYSF